MAGRANGDRRPEERGKGGSQGLTGPQKTRYKEEKSEKERVETEV